MTNDIHAQVNDPVKELGKLRVEMEDEDFLLAEDTGKLLIQTRETRRLRRNLVLMMQSAFAYSTLRCTGRQRIMGR